MKARLNNHAQLNALRRRLRQRAADAESTSAPTQTQQHPKTAGESHRVPKQPAEPSYPTQVENQSTHPKKSTINKKLKKGFDGVLTASDRSLFQEAMRTVQPLQKQSRHTPDPNKIAPTARDAQQIKQRRLRAESHRHEQLSTELSDHYDVYASVEHIEEYLNPICGTDVLRNLRRGQWPLEASIDLHGATLERARERLQSFLQHCFAEEYRCIRIVHGKGYGSANKEPVLLYQIRRWLTQLRPVLAFCDCAPNEGGQGAVKVLLRKSRR
ncbi:MAG TPA: Smr/MutS family protein [Paenalcaligenes sp.]|nr:Smr/MutS family protein [Paenalcaligenes sp.]